MKPSVLIVESDSIVLDQLSLFVRDCGYRVQIAADLDSAMQKLASNRLPIAIIDWELPEDQAVTLIRTIRDNHRLRRTHIIALASPENSDVLQAALSVGADDFFTKPIESNEVKTRLQWAVSRSQVIV